LYDREEERRKKVSIFQKEIKKRVFVFFIF